MHSTYLFIYLFIWFELNISIKIVEQHAASIDNTTLLWQVIDASILPKIYIIKLDTSNIDFSMKLSSFFSTKITYLGSLAAKSGWPSNITHFWKCRILCYFLAQFLTCSPMVISILGDMVLNNVGYHSFLNQSKIL